jgi:hypothetical protein
LHRWPKELRQPDKSKERSEWVRRTAEEYRRQLALDFADLDALFEGEGEARR